MKLAATYSRYSTEHQTDKSIADQQALCHEHARRLGVKIVRDYSDQAMTGQTMIGRDGLLDMMAAAKNREFDVVIVESLDRLSRDQAELATIHKRLNFENVVIETVHEGQASTMLVGLRGLIGQMFVEDTRHKVKRGLLGVIEDGRNPGGKSYGYRPRKGEPGILDIHEDEAAIVLRIFEAYAAGASPREIAGNLNAEGVLPPRGSEWTASTINGNKQRGNGILQNPLYHGELIWNRVRMIRDPDTGRRVSRVNPESEWKRKEAEHLRIVPEHLWQRVQARKRSRTIEHRAEQPLLRKKHLFSGLLRCGKCGGAMVVKETDAAGRIRVHCSKARESGGTGCTNRASYYISHIEKAVVDAFRDYFEDPDIGAELLEELLRKRAGVTDPKVIEADKRALLELEQAQKNLLAVAAGTTTSIPVLTAKLDELEKSRQDIVRKLDAAQAKQLDEGALHWGLAAYLQLIEGIPEIIESLAGPRGSTPEGQALRENIRSLFDRVIIHPGNPPTIEPIAAIPLSKPIARQYTGLGVVAEEGSTESTYRTVLK